MAWVAFAAPRGRMRGAATKAMRDIAEARQRRRRPRAAANPKGAWGLRPHASLLVGIDAPHRFLLAPRLGPASPMRATHAITQTHS